MMLHSRHYYGSQAVKGIKRAVVIGHQSGLWMAMVGALCGVVPNKIIVPLIQAEDLLTTFYRSFRASLL